MMLIKEWRSLRRIQEDSRLLSPETESLFCLLYVSLKEEEGRGGAGGGGGGRRKRTGRRGRRRGKRMEKSQKYLKKSHDY